MSLFELFRRVSTEAGSEARYAVTSTGSRGSLSTFPLSRFPFPEISGNHILAAPTSIHRASSLETRPAVRIPLNHSSRTRSAESCDRPWALAFAASSVPAWMRMSRRNVVTSWARLSRSSTTTVPCSIPTGTVRLNRRRTASGGAAVVRSKSWFSSPSRLSRMAPPTHQVSKPASSSVRATRSTSAGMGKRSGNVIRSGVGSPAQHTPSVHVEDLARDVPRQIGAEKHDRAGDVLGARDPPQRDRVLDLPPPLSRVAPVRLRRHLRLDPSGRHAIHVDLTRGELHGEGLGERDDRALGRGVIGMKRLAPLPRRGRDQHHLATVGQQWNSGAAHVQHRVQIDAHREVPLRVGHALERYLVGWPDAVVHDQQVQPAERLRCRGHRALRRGGVSQVTSDGDRPSPPSTALHRPDRFFRVRSPAPVANRHPAARPGEQHRCRPADAAAATRHKRALRRQIDHPTPSWASTIPQITCSIARCSSWICEVSSAGMTSASSTRRRAAPPPLPSSATTRTPLARAAWAARSTFALSPLVECNTSRSPGRTSASTCRAKTASNPRSLPHAVSSDVSVVKATAGRARRVRP